MIKKYFYNLTCLNCGMVSTSEIVISVAASIYWDEEFGDGKELAVNCSCGGKMMNGQNHTSTLTGIGCLRVRI